MSSFEVSVVRVSDVYDHPDADRLSIIKIGEYESISAKLENGDHRFSPGELAIYVPESAVISDRVLIERGFWNEEKNIGMLSGSKGNRVKAIKLRGVVSQGLVWKLAYYSPGEHWAETEYRNLLVSEGDDLADFFGIVKYEPPVPTSFAGHAGGISEAILHFDIENYKKYPQLLENQEVVVTEKIHGTCFRVTYIPMSRQITADRSNLFNYTVAVTSKGLGSKGLVLTNTPENREGNTYVRMAIELDMPSKLELVADELYPNKIVSVLGEIFGKGVQDLSYGFEKHTARFFDVHVEGIGWLDEDAKCEMFDALGVERVPVLYRGMFDAPLLWNMASGSTKYNSGFNIREGIVITAVNYNGPAQKTQRPILKMVSNEYLLRKNATEFQ